MKRTISLYIHHVRNLSVVYDLLQFLTIYAYFDSLTVDYILVAQQFLSYTSASDFSYYSTYYESETSDLNNQFGTYRIVEGSSDGGTSWNILDKQTSQMFDKRFHRETFKIESGRQMYNAFR